MQKRYFHLGLDLICHECLRCYSYRVFECRVTRLATPVFFIIIIESREGSALTSTQDVICMYIPNDGAKAVMNPCVSLWRSGLSMTIRQ